MPILRFTGLPRDQSLRLRWIIFRPAAAIFNENENGYKVNRNSSMDFSWLQPTTN
jgi:hypothetical protein